MKKLIRIEDLTDTRLKQLAKELEGAEPEHGAELRQYIMLRRNFRALADRLGVDRTFADRLAFGNAPLDTVRDCIRRVAAGERIQVVVKA
jgi:hypothetical protein